MDGSNDQGYPPGSTINPDGTVTNPSLGITNGEFTGDPSTLPTYNGVKVLPYGVTVVPPGYQSAAEVASFALAEAPGINSQRLEVDPAKYRAAEINLLNQLSGPGAQHTLDNLSGIADSLHASAEISNGGSATNSTTDPTLNPSLGGTNDNTTTTSTDSTTPTLSDYQKSLGITQDSSGHFIPPGETSETVSGGAPAWGKFGPTEGGKYYGGVWDPTETGTGQWIVGPGGTAPPDADPTQTITLKPGEAAMQVNGKYVAYNPNDPNDPNNMVDANGTVYSGGTSGLSQAAIQQMGLHPGGAGTSSNDATGAQLTDYQKGLGITQDSSGHFIPPGETSESVSGGAPAYGKFGPTEGGKYYGGVWGPNETGTGQTIVAAGATPPPDADPAKTIQLQPGQAAMQVNGTYVAYNPNDPNDPNNMVDANGTVYSGGTSGLSQAAVQQMGLHPGGSAPGTAVTPTGNPTPVGPQTSTYTGTAPHKPVSVSISGNSDSQDKSGSASAGAGVVPMSSDPMLLDHEKRVDTNPVKIKKN